MRTFRVYFKDGNQRLFQGKDIYTVLSYVVIDLLENAEDIIKVEELR